MVIILLKIVNYRIWCPGERNAEVTAYARSAFDRNISIMQRGHLGGERQTKTSPIVFSGETGVNLLKRREKICNIFFSDANSIIPDMKVNQAGSQIPEHFQGYLTTIG